MMNNVPPGYRPPRVSGFVNFADIPETLADNAQKEPGYGLWSVLSARRGQPLSFWLNFANWRGEVRWIETSLSTPLYRAAGIDEVSGDLVWIGPETWRRPFPLHDREISAVEAGLLGYPIPVFAPSGLLSCYPMLTIRDLARQFGAEFPTLPPAEPPNALLYLWQPSPPHSPLPSAPPKQVLTQILELGDQPQSAMATAADADLEPLTAALEGCFESEGKFSDLPEEVQARVNRISGSAVFAQFWDVIGPGQKRRRLAQQLDLSHAEAVLRQQARSRGIEWAEDPTWIKEDAPPIEPPAKPTKKPRLRDAELRQWWFHEYLPQYADNPDRRPSRGAQQNDAAERFPGHAKPSEPRMTRLRADKATPREWRDPGRKPEIE